MFATTFDFLFKFTLQNNSMNVRIIQILRTTAFISGTSHNASFLFDSGAIVKPSIHFVIFVTSINHSALCQSSLAW